jgi:taurine dioxygenase
MSRIRIEKLPAVLGARVHGLDPGGLDAAVGETLGSAFDARQVELHVEGRQVDRDNSVYVDEDHFIHVIDSNRNGANFWHTDATFKVEPPGASMIVARSIPSSGGDTLWLDTYAAFEALAEPIRGMLRQLRAIHGHPGASELNAHPMVRTHPRTGREALWVNRGWTTGIEDVSSRQAPALLRFLFDTMEQPEFTCRWSWTEGDVAVWDNRCTMHYALKDYGDEYRAMHRLTIRGEVPS